MRIPLLVLALSPISAFASGPETLVSDFMKAATTGDSEAAAALCTPEFQRRDRLGCSELARVLPDLNLEEGRRTLGEKEALVEFWLTERGERTPLQLLARETPEGWRWVDGTDVDGPRIVTNLTLPTQGPGAVEIPKAAQKLTNTLMGPKKKAIKACKAWFTELDETGCDKLVEALNSGFSLRPSQVREQDDRLVVTLLIEQGGRAEDETWMLLTQKGTDWKLHAIATDGAQATAFLRGATP